MFKTCAHRSSQMPTRRKSKHSNLVRIDMPLSRMKAHQPDRSLRIFQRLRRTSWSRFG